MDEDRQEEHQETFGEGSGLNPLPDDFDLEGLSLDDAKAYVARFITAKNQVAKDRTTAEQDLALWKKRTSLATERGETGLARESLARAEEAHSKLVRLKKEERELDFKVTELKRRLVGKRQHPEPSVNTDALLDQLEGVVGTDHETRDALVDAEAEVALEALKRKMESGGDE